MKKNEHERLQTQTYFLKLLLRIILKVSPTKSSLGSAGLWVRWVSSGSVCGGWGGAGTRTVL